MDEKDRYNKPKKINDILKDMKMDPESLKSRQKETELSTVDAIMKNLEIHITYMNALDTLPSKAAELMNIIEEKYTQEKKTLANIKNDIKQWHITQIDINEKIQNILWDLNVLEAHQSNIRKSFCKIIDIFDSDEDRNPHIKKMAMFSILFTDTYCEIDDIVEEYNQLLRKVPRK